MNILILFSQPWNVGGAETHVTDLVRGLTDMGHKVYMAIHGSNAAKKLEIYTAKQVLVNFRSANPLKYLFSGEELVRFVNDHKIDIMHAHQRTSGYLGAYVKWRTGIPFVVTIHDPWRHAPVKRLHAKLFDDIITVSEFLRKTFIKDFGFASQKVHTVYNGVDEDRYNPQNYQKTLLHQLKTEMGISTNDKVVSLIARLYSSKGHQYLIEAAPEIIKQVPAAKFLFVGSGDHEHKFRKQIDEKGLTDYFIFAGYREDIPELIAISDLVVRPSDMEGLPINLIEAMLMKKPVVATAIAGVPEMISPGLNGFMISPGNSSELAEKISIILKDESLSKKMGENGRSVALEKFTLQSLLRKVESIYNNVIATVMKVS